MTQLIGTRGSQLALAQAEDVRLAIGRLWPGEDVRLEVVRTMGDRISTRSLVPDAQDPPQGIFTRELDDALLSDRIRAAVHSLKDVPTSIPPGIRFGAFLKRVEPRDALVSGLGLRFSELPAGSTVGTGSPRRESQIRSARPDLVVVPLRGNVDSRLRKLKDGELDAVVVAAAGMIRLSRDSEITELMPVETMVPAPAQGVVCVTIRESDSELLSRLSSLNDPDTQTCAEAERAFLQKLQGGCRVPVGALARIEGETLNLSGFISGLRGGGVLRESRTASRLRPRELGEELADIFLKNGARRILDGFGRMT